MVLEAHSYSDFKFDLAVGNPPYQANIARAGANNVASATSVYPQFFELGYAVAKRVSILSPARWFNSPHALVKPSRVFVQNNNLMKHFRSLFFYQNSKNVFPHVIINGGVSFWLFDGSYDGETEFYQDGVFAGIKALVDTDGLINFDFHLEAIKNKIAQHEGFKKLSPIVDWKTAVEKVFSSRFGLSSTETMIKKTSSERTNNTDVALRIPRHGVRYAPRDWFNEKSSVPESKFAMAFAHASSRGSKSINDRTDFFTEYQSSKASTAVYVDSVEQLINLYKYSRTRLFCYLVSPRIAGHDTYAQAYQDVPWWFEFNDTDEIDWSKTVPEIDKQLIRYFGLEEHEAYIQETVTKPFAALLSTESIEAFGLCQDNIVAFDSW